MTDFIVINSNTGEVVSEGVSTWRTVEQEKSCRYIKRKQEGYKLDTLAGRNFTFMFMKEAVKEQYTLADLSRLGALIVLSTHIKQDSTGDKVARLPFKSVAEMATELKCSTRQAQVIWKDLEAIGAVYREDVGLFVNSELAYRGETKRNDIVKVFHMNTRALLADGIKLADIGLLFLTAPYIDRQTNYLCKNPNAPMSEELELIGFNELAELVGVDHKTLRNKFKKMFIEFEGKRLPVYLKVENPLNNKFAYILNPLVMNRGMNDSDITTLFTRL